MIRLQNKAPIIAGLSIVLILIGIIGLIVWRSQQFSDGQVVKMTGTLQKQEALGYVLLDDPSYSSPVQLVNAEESGVREVLDSHLLDASVSLSGTVQRLAGFDSSTVYGLYVLRVNGKKVAEVQGTTQTGATPMAPTVAGFVARLTDDEERACVERELTAGGVVDLETSTMNDLTDDILQKIAACTPEKTPQVNDWVRPNAAQ